MTAPRCPSPRRTWRGCCSSATRCSRSAASRSPAGSSPRSRRGVVTDPATLLAFARTAVEQASRGDGIGLVCAHRAASAGDIDEVVRIDALIYRPEALGRDADDVRAHGQEVHRNGRARDRFARSCATGANASLAGTTPGCYPVALAVNFAAQGLTARDAFVVHQYGVASTILGAALRLMRISHMDTQQMLYALNADVDAAYAAAAGPPSPTWPVSRRWRRSSRPSTSRRTCGCS